MGLTLSGPFRELAYILNGVTLVTIWDPNKVVNIWEQSIWVGGRLDRFYSTPIYIYIYIYNLK